MMINILYYTPSSLTNIIIIVIALYNIRVFSGSSIVKTEVIIIKNKIIDHYNFFSRIPCLLLRNIIRHNNIIVLPGWTRLSSPQRSTSTMRYYTLIRRRDMIIILS